MKIVLSCEHGGNEIPDEFAHLFEEGQEALASHRGWDPGALDLARAVKHRLGVPLVYWEISRLLVEANRYEEGSLWSEFTRDLPEDTRQRIKEKYRDPFHRELNFVLGRLMEDGPVVHVSIHSYTRILNGDVRGMDVGLLYDPSRPAECALASKLEPYFDDEFRVEHNGPYAGTMESTIAWNRRQFSPLLYAGKAVEVCNDKLTGPNTPKIEVLADQMACGLEDLLLRRAA